jgi:hypothetical protein
LDNEALKQEHIQVALGIRVSAARQEAAINDLAVFVDVVKIAVDPARRFARDSLYKAGRHPKWSLRQRWANSRATHQYGDVLRHRVGTERKLFVYVHHNYANVHERCTLRGYQSFLKNDNREGSPVKVYNGGTVALSAEDTALIKRLIAKGYGPLIVLKAWRLLDPSTGK